MLTDTIIPLSLVALGAYGVALMGGYGDQRSENPCPAEQKLGAYGPHARFDGIVISGSPAFVSKTVTALRRAYHIKSYRYITELDRIEERPSRSDAQAWVYRGTRTAFVGSNTADRSCTFYAAVLVHEGAHVALGSDHGPVFAAEAQALRELGEPAEAIRTSARRD